MNEWFKCSKNGLPTVNKNFWIVRNAGFTRFRHSKFTHRWKVKPQIKKMIVDLGIWDKIWWEVITLVPLREFQKMLKYSDLVKFFRECEINSALNKKKSLSYIKSIILPPPPSTLGSWCHSSVKIVKLCVHFVSVCQKVVYFVSGVCV